MPPDSSAAAAGLENVQHATTLLPNTPRDGKAMFVPWLKSRLASNSEPYKPKHDPKLPQPTDVARLAYLARRLVLRCWHDVDEAALAPGPAWEHGVLRAALDPAASFEDVRRGFEKAVAIATGGR